MDSRFFHPSHSRQTGRGQVDRRAVEGSWHHARHCPGHARAPCRHAPRTSHGGSAGAVCTCGGTRRVLAVRAMGRRLRAGCTTGTERGCGCYQHNSNLKNALVRPCIRWKGVRTKNLDYAEVVHVLVQRPYSSSWALRKTRETNWNHHLAIGLPDKEWA